MEVTDNSMKEIQGEPQTMSEHMPRNARPDSTHGVVAADLWKQLANAIHLNAKQDQIVWTIFGVFWAANAVLLVSLFKPTGIPEKHVGVLFSVVGLALSLVWWLIEKRAIAHLRFYEDIVERLETRLEVPAKYALSGRRNTELYKKHVGQGIRVRTVMMGSSICSMVLWAYFTLWFWFCG